MNRYSTVSTFFINLLVSLFVLLGISQNVFASSLDTESIVSFDSTIQVNTDSSIDVDEVIVYTTGPEEHHGIYRDIRTLSSTGQKMKISNIKVVNEKGNVYNFVHSSSGDIVRIKIGDANVTFSGQKTYHLSYHATNAIGNLSDVDEIYWNVTGNEWKFPINKATAKVILPEGVTALRSACYLGRFGSKETCLLGNKEMLGVDLFNSGRVLQSSEGFTVAVGFPKGVVTPYKESFFEKYGGVIGFVIFIIFVIAVFRFMFVFWLKNWRDPKGAGIIVPQYDVPEGLTPMEVDAIVNERLSPSNISAEIIYLATKGYIKIRQIETTTLIFFKSTDYEITCLNFDREKVSEWDKKILDAFFSSFKKYGNSRNLSEMRYTFYPKISAIKNSIFETLLEKKYYKNLGRIKNDLTLLQYFFWFIIYLFFTGFISILVAIFIFNAEKYYFVIPILLSIVFILLPIFSLIWYFTSPAKTEKGIELKEYLLGLKEYLQIAEKDRLIFHNAPEKKPEVFEKLLPYAMVLGVEKAWVKEFEDVYDIAPSWYEDIEGGNFSAVDLGRSLSGFSSFTASTLIPPPISMSRSGSSWSGGGGSSGGGSSGGGGGGGGGGSW